MRLRWKSPLLTALIGTALVAPSGVALGAPLVAYAATESVHLGGHSLVEPGDAFYNGKNFAPVTIVYGQHVYVAARFVAAIYHLSIGWASKSSTVVLGNGPPVLVPDTAQMKHPTFSGRFLVEARYLNVTVRGRSYTPSARVVRYGSSVLPDALYASHTMYLPISLLGRSLGAAVVWPKGQKGPTAQGGFAVQIATPLHRLVAGTVLAVQGVVSGVPQSHQISYAWQLRDPKGLEVPLLDGNSAQSEQVALPISTPAGTFRLSVTAHDLTTGQHVTTTINVAVAAHPAGGAGAAPFGFDPATIARAYGIYNVWLEGDLGQGNEIFLYEQQGINMGDIATFDSAYGLPAPELSVIPPVSGSLPAGLEATMDVEWAHALAPLARIVMIEDPTTDPGSFPNSLAQSLQTSFFNGSEIASISYGIAANAAADSAASATISALSGQGFSVFAASGESQTDSPGASLQWPGTDPSVVSVGGTSLFEKNPAFFLETYWEGPYLTSVYGPTSLPSPYWQRAVTGQSNRLVPDVAFDANPRTGVAVYVDGSWWLNGGTSLGAPSWAAIWALCRTDAQNLPSAPIALYKVAQSRFGPYALHNPAHVLYDSRTGLGTPNVSELIYALQQIYGH